MFPGATFRPDLAPVEQVDVETLGQHELDDMLAAESGDEFAWRAEGDDPAVIHDGYRVAELLGLFHVMGGQDDRFTVRLDLVDDVPQVVPRLGVEPRRGGRVREEYDVTGRR